MFGSSIKDLFFLLKPTISTLLQPEVNGYHTLWEIRLGCCRDTTTEFGYNY